MFRLKGEITHIGSNWQSNFEVKSQGHWGELHIASGFSLKSRHSNSLCTCWSHTDVVLNSQSQSVTQPVVFWMHECAVSSYKLLLFTPRMVLTLSTKAFNVSTPSVWDSLSYNTRSANTSRCNLTRGQSNLTKSASRGAHSPVRGHPRGSKVVPLNSWGRVSY